MSEKTKISVNRKHRKKQKNIVEVKIECKLEE